MFPVCSQRLRGDSTRLALEIEREGGPGVGLHEGQAEGAQWESKEPSSEAGAGRWCVCRGLRSVCEDGDPCVEVSLPRQWVCWVLSQGEQFQECLLMYVLYVGYHCIM